MSHNSAAQVKYLCEVSLFSMFSIVVVDLPGKVWSIDAAVAMTSDIEWVRLELGPGSEELRDHVISVH